jgi:hypothetical protein
MAFWIEKMKNESNTTFFMLCVREDYCWLDNYETFLDLLEHNCGCTIVSDESIVFVRRVRLEKDGYEFSFYHDTLYGAYICTQEDAAIATLEAVANDVMAEVEKYAKEIIAQESM